MSIPVFYVPGLIPGSGNADVPQQVIFFPTGLAAVQPLRAGGRPAALPRANGISGPETGPVLEEVRKALPLGPKEARAALADMLRIGEEYSAGGLLKELAAHQRLLQTPGRWEARPGESADLAFFARTGEVPAGEGKVKMTDWSAPARAESASAADIRLELENCQKVLLLAETLQQREQELADLERRYAGLESSLHDLLREGQEESFPEDGPAYSGHGPDPEDGTAPAGDPPTSLSWRAVVDAMLPFLPENAVLFTDDSRMALDMRDAGMLHPFSEDKAALCAGWPPDLLAGLLHASLPGWRLVGRRGPSMARPWLEREVEVLVARPKGGWAAPSQGGAMARDNTKTGVS